MFSYATRKNKPAKGTGLKRQHMKKSEEGRGRKTAKSFGGPVAVL